MMTYVRTCALGTSFSSNRTKDRTTGPGMKSIMVDQIMNGGRTRDLKGLIFASKRNWPQRG